MSRYQFVGDYLAFCRKAFEVTGQGRHIQIHWAGQPLDATGWRAEFMKALNRRITGSKPLNHRGKPCRRLAPDYQVHQSQDAKCIHDYSQRRIVHPMNRLRTKELQERFQWSYTCDGLDIRLYSNRA